MGDPVVIKKFWKKYAALILSSLLITAVYTAEAFARPMIAPAEFDFLLKLRAIFPEFPLNMFLLRFPAVLGMLVSGVVVFEIAREFDFRRPGSAALFFLLLPPVFFWGTIGCGGALFILGALVAVWGGIVLFRHSGWRNKFRGVAAIVAGAVLLSGLVMSHFFEKSMFFLLLLPAFSLLVSAFFEYRVSRDKKAVCRQLDTWARIASVFLILLALVVLIPALLRVLKVDFPDGFSLYRRGDRIVRPMLLLLLPVFWLQLAREAGKLRRKLTFHGMALGFILLLLPVAMPLQWQKQLYWQFGFKQMMNTIPCENTCALVDREFESFFKTVYPEIPVKVLGRDGGKPEEMAKIIRNMVDDSAVLVVFRGHRMEKSCPALNCTKYMIGEIRLYRYFKGAAK